MEDLKIAEKNLIDKLNEIRNKENKTLNDMEEYKNAQENLRKIHEVMNLIRKLK